MKKTRKRLALDKNTLRNLTASDTAQVVGGVITGVCTLYPSCPD